MAGSHNSIIASVAKPVLGLHGFQRIGRSRTWLADHGWWATIVEFQPSSWSKGSSLNVGAHWLWSVFDHISFDYGYRVEGYVEYISDEQFTSDVCTLVSRAEQEAMRLAGLFNSLPNTATLLLAKEQQTTRVGWGDFHAGVAAGLAGLKNDAHDMFARILESGRNTSHSSLSPMTLAAARMLSLLDDPDTFRSEVTSIITQHRIALRLPSSATYALGHPYS